MKFIRIVVFVGLIGFYTMNTSCKKKELPVPKHASGNLLSAGVNMEANYIWQIYFDLKTNSIVKQNLRTIWDLAFEATSDGYHIRLNSAKPMYAFNTGATNFENVKDTIGFELNKKWDDPSGRLDSTAIGDWRQKNSVYIIDKGYNEMGVHFGFQKIQFQNFDADKYIVKFSKLNGSDETVLHIKKDSSYNFQFLSFEAKGVLIVEPPKTAWDLCFTQYTHVFNDPVTPYLVSGCLLNHFNTCAVLDSISPFSQITYADISKYTLSKKSNIIGYNWKKFSGNIYVVFPHMNYVISDNEGIYYKLHFIDFYSILGRKGNPRWEYQRL